MNINQLPLLGLKTETKKAILKCFCKKKRGGKEKSDTYNFDTFAEYEFFSR